MNQVTAEDVATAAWELQHAGENPSVRAVRDKLGSGSATTVNKYLKLWREEMAQRAEREPIPEALLRALEDVWQLALDQAQTEFEEDRNVWQEQDETTRAESKTLKKRISELEQLRESARQAHNKLEQALQTSESSVTTLTVERERLVEQLEGQARLIDELQQTRAETEAHYAEALQRVESQFNHDIKLTRQSSADTEARLMVQLDEERQRTKVAEKTNAALNREQSIERQAWDEARTSLHTTQQTELREWLDQIASERSAKAEAEAEVRVRREQMENVKMENRELVRAAHVAAGEIARLEERLARQETEAARIFKTTPSVPKEHRSSRRKQDLAPDDDN